MTITRRSLLAGLPLLVAGPGAADAERAPPRVYLQPYGKALDDKDVAFLERALLAFFTVDVVKLARAQHPQAAWYAPRKRWRADVLLDDLQARMPSDGVQILGLTQADISVTKGAIPDWGVLGYGMIGGPACVVSRHRCRIGARSAAHVRERLAKVCLHELGHTLGSDHCPEPACLMRDAEGQVKPLDVELDFCAKTRARFRRRGAPLVEPVKLPWS